MQRKRVSNQDLAALGKFQGTIDRNSNFRDQAFNHNLGRNVRVVKVLTYLAKMAQDGCRFIGAVECVAAERQNFSSPTTLTQMGHEAPPSQAAHFLPGQLQIGGQNVWELVSDYWTSSRLEFLFAEVEHLPVAFNQADSAAENKGEQTGLAAAFAAASAALITQAESLRTGAVPNPHSPTGKLFNWASVGLPHPDSPAARTFDWSALGAPHPDSPAALGSALGGVFLKKPGGNGELNIMALVPAAFAVWDGGAKDALAQAAKAKRAKPGLPPLVGDPFEGYTPESIEARSTADSSLWNQDDAVRILEYYLEDQQQRTPDWARGICGSSLSDL